MQNIQMQALWTSSHILCYLLSDNSCETFLGKSISGIKKIKIEIFFKFFLKNLANTRQSGTCPKKKKENNKSRIIFKKLYTHKGTCKLLLQHTIRMHVY